MKLVGEHIRNALEITGLRLGSGPEIELLIVGGAAGLLSGLLRPERTTSDVDVLHIVPSQEGDKLFAVAAEVGRERGLPNDWLNGETGLYREGLPETWKERRGLIGRFGRLSVYAVGRADLIAMKLYAGRPQDIEDLLDLAPTVEDLKFAREHIAQIGDTGQVLRALERIDHWGH